MKKAIFVDGPSFSAILKAIGIYNWHFGEFLQILVNEVGEARELVNKPVYVSAESFLKPIEKALQAVGYETVAIGTEDSKDDEFIKREIRNLPPGSVDEIVLVSADLDYLEELKKKEESGVKVFVAATTENDPRRGGPIISDVLKNAFSFVELAQFKNRIMKSPFVPKPRREQDEAASQLSSSNGHLQNLEIKLQLRADSSEVAALWAHVAGIIAKHPSVEISSSVTNLKNP